MGRSFQKRVFAEIVIPGVSKIRAGYDKEQMLSLLRAVFDSEYPSQFFRDHLPKEEADKLIKAKILASHEAAIFVEENFRNWLDVIFLLLATIARQVGERTLAKVAAGDDAPARYRHHNIRQYKQSARWLTDKLIDSLHLSKSKGGRPKDESLTSLLESAFSELARSEEEVSQEDFLNFLRRKTGKPLSLEAARKRLSRKGKTLSEAKDKKRKPRKRK